MDKPEIQGREIKWPQDYLSCVTYVPHHASGNAGHKDCEQGVIISIRDGAVRVLYSKSRSVQLTDFHLLVWG